MTRTGTWSGGEPVEISSALAPLHLYPAITACMCEERQPSRYEIRIVASRLWQEGFSQRFGSFSFAARRALLRAARTALSGRSESGRPL